MDFHVLVLLLLAALIGGSVNTVIGGGSLITFPALLAAGYNPITANVTNTLALLPGFVGGAIGYRRELRGQHSSLVILGVPCGVGAVIGSLLLTRSSPSSFAHLVPYLLFAGSILMAVQPLIAERINAVPSMARPRHWCAAASVSILIGFYGGYFPAGLGIIMLAVYATVMRQDFQRTNALKVALLLVIMGVAAASFLIVAPIAWAVVPLMAVGSLLGGHVGVAIARRIHPVALRVATVAVGTTVGLRLLL